MSPMQDHPITRRLKRPILLGWLIAGATGPAFADVLTLYEPFDGARKEAILAALGDADRIATPAGSGLTSVRVRFLGVTQPAVRLGGPVTVRLQGLNAEQGVVADVVLTTRPQTIVNTLDSDFDLVRLLSDRHELAGVALCSDEHFDLLRGVLDPTGALGVRGAAAPVPAPSPTLEGRCIWLASREPVTFESLFQSGQFPDPLAAVPVVSPGGTGALIHFERLSLTAARALEQPALFEPGFHERAVRTLGFFLEFATLDPTSAQGEDAARLVRLRGMGAEVFWSLTNLLEPRVPTRVVRRMAELQGHDPDQTFFPVDWHVETSEAAVATALRVIERAPQLRRGPEWVPSWIAPYEAALADWAAPDDTDIVPFIDSTERTDTGPRYDETSIGQLARAIVKAAAGVAVHGGSPGEPDPDLTWEYRPAPDTRARAIAILVAWLTPQDDDAEVVRDHQQQLRGWLLEQLRQAPWTRGDGQPEIDGAYSFVPPALEVLAATGFGRPGEFMPVVTEITGEYLSRSPRGEATTQDLRPAGVAMCREVLRALAHDDDPRTAGVVRGYLNGRRDEYVERRERKRIDAESRNEAPPATPVEDHVIGLLDAVLEAGR